MSNQRPDNDAPPETTARRRIAVLLATVEPSMSAKVRAALEGERFSIDDGTASLEHTVPDVVVTDQPLTSAALLKHSTKLIEGEVGVVLIGRALPADVQLPADFTRRELRLAVSLLAQVVGSRRQQHHWRQIAELDPLTRLPHRGTVEKHFEQLIDQCDALVALALFDLDQFKRINAESGYLHGDEVLRGAAKVLARQCQPQFVARLGGDEFLLLWCADSVTSAREFAERCRQAIGTAASLKAQRPLSASAGLAFAKRSDAYEKLFEAADAALRRAKAAGGRRLEAEVPAN